MSVVGSLIDDAIWEKEKARDLPLWSSPWPVLAIASAYLYFVLRAGPRMMEKRPPYSLRGLIVAYNLFIVLGSVWLLAEMMMVSSGNFFKAHCVPNSLDPKIYKGINDMGYWYFMTKVIELLDTVFFILRKKTNQVSFLHVYHHSNMVVMTWIFLHSLPASQLLIICCSNTFVHIVMYGYYCLSALGPSVQKYLWWKKYLTRLQLVQFVIIMLFLMNLILSPGCQLRKQMYILAICNTASFFILFIFFYAREYSQKRNKDK